MNKAVAILIPGIFISGLASVSEGGFYRWVDKNGEVHYSDSVPPDQVRSGHTELSKEGVRTKSVPPVKTPEELRKERELERLRTQQERLIAQQRSVDRVLLRTFRSEDDIEMALDGKLAAIDVMISVTKGNIRRQQEWLYGLRAEAGDLERTGKPIPKQTSESIAQTQRAIWDAYATIVDRERQKDSIRNNFEKDLARFRQLKDLPVSDSPLPVEDTQTVLHNIVTCSSVDECDQLWTKAIEYVRENATTTPQPGGENIFITAPPTDDRDVSLILTRINDKNGPGASLFLDLQCKRSTQGEELCEGELAQRIVGGFRPAVAGVDAP